MTSLLLADGTAIDVPSLGFGPAWRGARRLLSRLHAVRLRPPLPLGRSDALLVLLGIERGERDLLETENRLWRALFTACQARAGYTRRECRRLLDGPLSYADRHAYEQLLLFGEIHADSRGLKKNTAPAPTANGSAAALPAASNGSAASTSASPCRENSPRPISSSSVPPTGAKPPCARCLPFWTRPSPRPTTRPASTSSPSSES